MNTKALLAVLLAPAAPLAAYEFDLGPAGTVTVDIPGGWNQPVETRPKAGVTQFRINSLSEGNAAVIGTMISGSGFLAPRDRIKQEFELSCSPYLLQAVEDSIEVRPLNTVRGAVGFYTTLTEADLVDAPTGGARTKTSTRCVVVLSNTVKAIVAVYCDDPTTPVFQQAISILESFRHAR